MRQGGLKPKSHSSGVYWTRANSNTGGSKVTNQSEPIGVFEILVLTVSIGILILALPLFVIYEIYRKISDRG